MSRRHRANRRAKHKPRIRRRAPPGGPPVSLSSPPGAFAPQISIIAYDGDQFVERTFAELPPLDDWIGKYAVVWLNIDGLADATIIETVGRQLGFHPLAMEDVVHVHQRSKVEPFESHLFLVARMLTDPALPDTEQLSMFLGSNYLITFQERPGDCLDPVRDRLRFNRGRIRRVGPDYLTYAILDAVIDAYFPMVDKLVDRMEIAESDIESRANPQGLALVHDVRNDLLLVRRSVRPLRETLAELIRDEHPQVDAETQIYLRDCYDHTVQLTELVDLYREMCSDLRDYYMSVVSNRMNQVIKVLTMIATIFMPLSFIAGVYGMNFDTSLPGNMPELKWPYGYVFSLGLMALVAGVMMLYFRAAGWIGKSRGP
jgi:magnesium transporter